MRLSLVRRTRSFIQENYAKYDPKRKRKFLEFADGTRSYFPDRIPRTVKFKISEKDPNDQYARLYADDVVRTVNDLTLPRYGLGNYQKPSPHKPPTPDEARSLINGVQKSELNSSNYSAMPLPDQLWFRGRCQSSHQ